MGVSAAQLCHKAVPLSYSYPNTHLDENAVTQWLQVGNLITTWHQTNDILLLRSTPATATSHHAVVVAHVKHVLPPASIL